MAAFWRLIARVRESVRGAGRGLAAVDTSAAATSAAVASVVIVAGAVASLASPENDRYWPCIHGIGSSVVYKRETR